MLTAPKKIILTFIYIIVLFVINTYIGYGVMLGILILACVISKVSFYDFIKFLKKILAIIIFTAIINMLFIEGNVIFQLGIIKISSEGIAFGIKMIVRIICLVFSTHILTHTTTPLELAYGIEKLMKPLNKIKFPVKEFSMILSIALRFAPILIEENKKMSRAQKARGIEINSKNIFKRIKNLNAIVIPLLVSIFRRSEQIAIAMESRCYNIK